MIVTELFDKQVFPDRPWNGRGYGRLRLNEGDAQDLYQVLTVELGHRLTAMKEARAEGRDAAQEKAAIKRIDRMRKYIRNMILEQGWQEPT